MTAGGELIGAVLDRRYRIDAPIARGGMSMVFRGVDTRLGRPVAIKVMDPKFAGDPQFLSRFEFEARAVAGLKHPSLVEVYDQGVDGEYPFLVMELVQGGTLRELLRERGPMPPHAVRAVAEPVLAAIGVAHAAGLVHRDVKPENVLISDGGDVKIADFGLVRAVAAANTTSASVILGTAAYLSPEQVTSGSADARSDVYAFGILIFELLTGKVPFTGDNSLSVAYQRVENDVPSPSEFIAGVPPEFDRLVARATAREPAHRFADAGEMVAELRAIAARLNLPEYRVPAPQDSAEHTSARHPVTRAVPEPVAAHGPQPTRMVTTARPRTDPPPPPAYIPPQQPTRYSSYQESRGNGRRNGMIWTAAVVVLTLLVGIGGWWLGMGRYNTVPSVAGMTVEQATAELQEAGFDTGTRDKASDTVPVGGVVGTDPGPGARKTKGSTVDILVSSGKPEVPAVAPGADWEEVQQLIRDQGLQPVDGGEVASTAPEGTLARIDPAPGTVLPAGAHVQIWKSNGSRPVQLPDLRADTPDEARKKLEDLGLTVAGERPAYDELVEVGRVIGTEPGVGTTVDAGSAVTLLICEAVTMPSVVGKSVAEARRTLQGLGLQVQVRQFAPLDSSVVVSQNPAANANVETGGSVSVVAIP
ncbi:Stk1 family PASTA domain-containing Ser/Thr kinase [Nocardia carnea]|uniref:Stk1 family PASTA domain-containing Ser/Thr kinase n=1 Tax=Nocardia carnea TaxID=37328 RepID=UPI002457CB16|nr:Stk1 family PASTA domain-containing Ser/Thr kinase [Nocardia carnea]